ncbi:MAG: PAS domain S-box protein [Bacteroidetes bacterium]|nr:PAS domain S-box protein [Bacteroidota bacterium]
MANSGKFSSPDYYRSLFANAKMNSVLIIDPNGIILEANRAFLSSFGYSEADIVGENFSILFTQADQKKDLPLRELRTVIDEGQSFDNNYLVNKNKTLTWVSGESLLLTNDRHEKLILKVIQNIHAQKESEFSIIRLNNFNENILGTIEDGVIVLDENLKILKANRSFTQIFNFSDKDVSKIDFKAFISTFDINSELYNAILGVFQSKSNISRIQLEMDSPGMERRTFDISCTQLAEEGEQTRILLIFHDITAQKQFEKQREDILNFVAHEFRNPLTNVILNIDLVDEMLKEKNLDEFRGFMERTRVNAQRLKRLINELYKTTKLISGNFDPERSVFTLEEVIDEAIESVQQVHRQFTISKKGDPQVPLFADKEKLIQVITNYLTNAVKYSNGNYDIEVGCFLEGDSVVVSVRDYGKGIPAKDLPYIFNRFYRAQKTKNLEGLGLGLFLSRQIVTAHGGRTWVESEEGKGSTFYFSLLLPVSEEQAPE